MPFVKWPQQALGFKIRKRLGKPNMFGWLIPGWSDYGDDNIFSGVYQQRRSRTWNGAGGFIIGKKPNNFWQCPAWPKNTITTYKINAQNNFKTALLAWQNLTDEEKDVYNKLATKRSKRGYDVFMSKTLKSL